MKFKLFDISIETPKDWRIRITESSNYESGRMAVISPKKLYIAIRWQNTDIKKTSLKDYIEEVLTQRKDKRIKDLKILENTGFEKEGHEYRFIRVSFIYKKFLNPPKPQEYIGYLILCKRTNRLIGAFTNYPIEAVDESIEYLEKPLKSINCECNKQ